MNEKELLQRVLSEYSVFLVDELQGRYITTMHLEAVLPRFSGIFEIEEEGRSELNTPIYSITCGSGPIKILGWSQMHGNESTTTKAVFDLLNLFSTDLASEEASRILDLCSIKLIPMLNPDGAARYTRVNENLVDLNRDAHNLTQKESQVLNQCYRNFLPNFCLNLHDQRTIFSAGDTEKPATLSFLAPAMDEDRTVDGERKKAMQVIAGMNEDLQPFLPGMIGKYDDAFNINCTGDTFQASGVPTILFEAGHFPGDYLREETRKYMTLAILTALRHISRGSYSRFDIASYSAIPENRKNYCDILLKNAVIEGEIMEVAIQFQEKLEGRSISFQPVVQKIAVTVPFSGHRSIDCERKEVSNSAGKRLAENDIVDAIMLNKECFLLNIE